MNVLDWLVLLAAVVGVAECDEIGVVPGKSTLQLQGEAALNALSDAGLSLRDVDGLLSTGMWGVPGPGQMPTLTLAEYFGIAPRLEVLLEHQQVAQTDSDQSLSRAECPDLPGPDSAFDCFGVAFPASRDIGD